MKVKTIMKIFPLILFVAGCASYNGNSGGNGIVDRVQPVVITEENEERIAVDLVSALMQIPKTAPFHTTVQFTKPKSTFSEKLLEVMEISGYGIQIVDADQGQNYVTYRASNDIENTNGVQYVLNINNYTVSRKYEMDSGDIFPNSEVFIKGVKPSNMIVNNDIFRQNRRGRVFPTGVSFINANGELLKGSVHMARSSVEKTKNYVFQRDIIIAKSSIFTNHRMRPGPALHDRSSFETLKSLVIGFSRRGIDLGQVNKKAILDIINSTSDDQIFVITGCTHGKSLMWDGTEALGLERAMRLREELCFQELLTIG